MISQFITFALKCSLCRYKSVPFTWDIFHEKWGWMLIWWNLAVRGMYSCVEFSLHVALKAPDDPTLELLDPIL